MLDPPKLVTLLPEEEEEEEPPVSRDLQVVKKLIVDVTVVVGLKLALVFATRKLARTLREVGKLDIPNPRYPD